MAVKEDGAITSGELGPNFDIYVRAIGARKHWAGFRLDESKDPNGACEDWIPTPPKNRRDDPEEEKKIDEHASLIRWCGA